MNTDVEEAETEIPAVTITSLTTNKIKEINIKKYTAKKIAKLFISDILNTEKVKRCEHEDRKFVMGDLVFRSVYIKGTIIGFQNIQMKTKERTLISVDDGTGVLDCYTEEGTDLENQRQAVQQHLHSTEELYKSDDNPSEILRASLMMLRSAQDKMNKLHPPKYFKLGDMVELIGNISEYNGKRTCFTTSVLRDTSDTNADHLENLLGLYEKIYNI